MSIDNKLDSVFLEIESGLRSKGLRSMIFLRDTINEKYPEYDFGFLYVGDDLLISEVKSGKHIYIKGGRLNDKNT